MRTRTDCIRSVATLLFLSCLLLPACGKKIWPEPQLAEDKFRFESVQAFSLEGCLTTSAFVSGRFENLDTVFLELEYAGDDVCPGCPFTPSRVLTFNPYESRVHMEGPQLRITLCSAAAQDVLRIRLRGTNIYGTLQETASEPVRVRQTERR
ncbi:MAG: hypothetical protein ACLFTB_02645 [Desulfovibrionales bacterium]